jgi:hypothetical protein
MRARPRSSAPPAWLQDRRPSREAACARTACTLTSMSGTTVFGIVLIVFSVLAVSVVAVLFVWGAREDGRDQARLDLRLHRDSKKLPPDAP